MPTIRNIAGAIALWTVYVPLAHAQDLGKSTLDSVAGTASIKSTNDLPKIIGNLLKVFTGLLGVIFLLLTVYAGYLYLTAAGDEDKVKHAKETLQRGVIGLVILASAYALTTFVIGALTKTAGSSGT